MKHSSRLWKRRAIPLSASNKIDEKATPPDFDEIGRGLRYDKVAGSMSVKVLFSQFISYVKPSGKSPMG